MKILLVEDDARAAEATLRALRQAGYERVLCIVNPDPVLAAADAVRVMVCCEFDALVIDGLDGHSRTVLRSPSRPNRCVLFTGEPHKYSRASAFVVSKPNFGSMLAAVRPSGGR